MVWLLLLLLVSLLCVCKFVCLGSMSFSARSPLLVYCTEACVGFLFCFMFGAGSPWLVYCTLCLYLLCLVSCLVLGLLCWCTALCFCVCLFLFCPVFVLCWVLGWEFLFMVGRVRFPGEVGELAPYGGAPYLGWTHSAGLALYPRFG